MLKNTGLADTLRMQLLSDLSWNYLEENLDTADQFAKSELQLAIEKKNMRYEAQAYNDLGIVAIRRGKFREALQLHKKALELRLKLGNELDVASSYNKIGICYTELTDLIPALDADFKALGIFEKLDQKNSQAYILLNICDVYGKLKSYRNLLTYAKKALELARDTKDTSRMASAQNQIATSYEGKNDMNSAMIAEKEALRLYKLADDQNGVATSYNNIGYYYRKLNDMDQAINYYKEAIAVAEMVADPSSLMGYYKNAGAALVVARKLPEAKFYLDKAVSLVTLESMPEELIGLNRAQGDLCVLTNHTEQAFSFYDRANKISDSLFSADLATRFSDMEVRYETDKKNEQNRVLQQENYLQTDQLKTSRLVQLALGLGVIVVGLIFFLVYNRSRTKQKQILDAELLHQKQLRANAVIAAEENERTRISRELHDGIGQQLSAAKLNMSGLQSLVPDKDGETGKLLQNALSLLDDSIKEIRQVSHQMMANTLLKSGLTSAVREFLNRIESRRLKVNLEVVDMDIRIEPGAEIVIFRILQEVVNNILRHANANEITIQIIKHDTELSVMVEDNGIGFEVDRVLDTGSGIGMKNIRSRVEFLNGEVLFDSYPGKGTTVNISIPLT